MRDIGGIVISSNFVSAAMLFFILMILACILWVQHRYMHNHSQCAYRNKPCAKESTFI